MAIEISFSRDFMELWVAKMRTKAPIWAFAILLLFDHTIFLLSTIFEPTVIKVRAAIESNIGVISFINRRVLSNSIPFEASRLFNFGLDVSSVTINCDKNIIYRW